ncbi:MAG: thioesterase family protein [Solirubrobacterales bacterium]
MAEAQAPPRTALGTFDRDTAVRELRRNESDERPLQVEFAADVSPDWRAGRGPHGGYIAAMLMRALIETVADPSRAPRSLTIHYARAPQPGPVSIVTSIERAGRSLSTLSARMEQRGKLITLALAAFSVPWSAPEVLELPMPDVAPADPVRQAGVPLFAGAPPFTRHIVVQGRSDAVPFTGSDAPMEIGAWLGLAEPRAIDPISLAFFSDALFSPPFIRLSDPASTPTVDLTVHFRTALAPAARAAGGGSDDGDSPGGLPLHELCFARFRSGLVQDGFFEEDGVIWAADGTVLAQSRQLGIVMAPAP